MNQRHRKLTMKKFLTVYRAVKGTTADMGQAIRDMAVGPGRAVRGMAVGPGRAGKGTTADMGRAVRGMAMRLGMAMTLVLGLGLAVSCGHDAEPETYALMYGVWIGSGEGRGGTIIASGEVRDHAVEEVIIRLSVKDMRPL